MHALSTARLELEPLSARHAEMLIDPLLDPRLWTYLPHLRPADSDAVRTRLRRWLDPPPPELPDAVAFENWVGFERTTGALVGTFQATIIRNASATIGYIVFPDSARRGYAVEAMTEVCAHLRDAHAIQRIRADMDRRNEASAAVAQRLGMTEIPPPNPTDRAFEKTVN
jgi:ribosomal-protein-alanine N-acetyltransferase